MAVHAGPDIVSDGLIFCIDAGDDRSYSGTGTKWSSLIGDIQLDLTGTTFNTENGRAIEFNGSNNYARVYNSALNISTGDFTIDVWFYYMSPQVGNYRKLMGTGTYLQRGYMIIVNDTTTNPIFGMQYGTSSWNSVGSGIPLINKWNHAIVTRLGGVLTVYLNSVSIGSASVSYDFSNTTNVFVIGANAGTGENFKGRIGSVKQYSRGFTQSEVLQNYNALRGRFGL